MGHLCPVAGEAVDGDDEAEDVDNVQDQDHQVDVQELSALTKYPKP